MSKDVKKHTAFAVLFRGDRSRDLARDPEEQGARVEIINSEVDHNNEIDK